MLFCNLITGFVLKYLLIGVGKLQVYVTDDAGQAELWSQDGPSGDGWRYAGIFVGEKQEANMTFVGTLGSNKNGDIALDDIHFSRCGAEATNLYLLGELGEVCDL